MAERSYENRPAPSREPSQCEKEEEMVMETRVLVEPQRCLCRELVSHCWSDPQELSRTMTWQGDLAEYVVIPQVKK